MPQIISKTPSFHPSKIENILLPLSKENTNIKRIIYTIASIAIGILTFFIAHLYVYTKYFSIANKKIINVSSRNQKLLAQNNDALIKSETTKPEVTKLDPVIKKPQPTKTKNLGIGEYPQDLSQEDIQEINQKVEWHPINNLKIAKIAGAALATAAIGVTPFSLIGALGLGAAGVATSTWGYIKQIPIPALIKSKIPISKAIPKNVSRILPPSTSGLENQMKLEHAKVGEWGDIESCHFCKDSVETTELKLKLVKEAKQEILISGSYCGGKIFDTFMQEIEKALLDPKKPDLKVRIISGTEFITNQFGSNNWSNIDRLTKKFPERFQVVITPQLRANFPQEEGLDFKLVGNHAKFCVFDRRYLIVGGSGIEDRWASVRADGEVEDTEDIPSNDWRSWIAKGFRDADVCVYSTKANSPVQVAVKEFYKLLSWYDYYNHTTEFPHPKSQAITNARSAAMRLDSASTIAEKRNFIKKAKKEILIADQFVGEQGFSSLLKDIKNQLKKEEELKVSILCSSTFLKNEQYFHWRKITRLAEKYPNRFRLVLSHRKNHKTQEHLTNYPKLFLVDSEKLILGGSKISPQPTVVNGSTALTKIKLDDIQDLRNKFFTTLQQWDDFSHTLPIHHKKSEMDQVRLASLKKDHNHTLNKMADLIHKAKNELIISDPNIDTDNLTFLLNECTKALENNKNLHIKFLVSNTELSKATSLNHSKALLLLANRFPHRFDYIISQLSDENANLHLTYPKVLITDAVAAIINNEYVTSTTPEDLSIKKISNGILHTMDLWEEYNRTSETCPAAQRILNKINIQTTKKFDEFKQILIKSATKEIILYDLHMNNQDFYNTLRAIEKQIIQNPELKVSMTASSLLITDRHSLNQWKLINSLIAKYPQKFLFTVQNNENFDRESSSLVIVDGNRLLEGKNSSENHSEYLESIDSNTQEIIKIKRNNIVQKISDHHLKKQHPRINTENFKNFTPWNNPETALREELKNQFDAIDSNLLKTKRTPISETSPEYKESWKKYAETSTLEYFLTQSTALQEFLRPSATSKIAVLWPEFTNQAVDQNKHHDYSFFDNELFNYKNSELKNFFKPLNMNNVIGLLPEIKNKNVLKNKTNNKAKVLVSSAQHRYSSLAKELCHYISKAKKSIHINHMYFQPNKNLYNAIKNALEKGIDVHLITNGRQKDCPRGHNSFGARNRIEYEKLLALNSPYFHVHEWNIPRTTNHKKIVVIDGKKIILGSSNMSYKGLSSQSDIEFNLAIKSPELGQEIIQDFEKDKTLSRKIAMRENNLWDHLYDKSNAFAHYMTQKQFG